MPEAIAILEFANALAIGGTERQFVNLVRTIDPARFRVHVGALARGGPLAAEIDAARVPMAEYRVRHLYGLRTIAQQIRFARYLARERIELVHTHGFYANVFALPPAWLARTSVRIASIRDDGSVWTPKQRAVERIACRLADCTVVNAEIIRRRLLEEGWPSDGVAVIPNGVDIARFDEQRTPLDLHREFGFPETAPIVGVVARLAPCKGLEVFLDAARIVANRLPDVRFLVVGDEANLGDDRIRVGGAYRQALELHAERLGLADRVVFAGFRLDVPAVLAGLTVSVLPSVTGEGLPNSVLEAMAAGLPVVATDSGGTSEAIVNGETGFVVPPSDAPALAQGIVSLLDDPSLRAHMGAAGRRRIAEHFSLDRMAREMQSLYAHLIERRQRVATPEPEASVA